MAGPQYAKGYNALSVNTKSLKVFASVLRKEQLEVAKRLRLRLKAAGEIVAADARARAKVGMPTNPPRIKVSVSGLRAVSVTAERTVKNAEGERVELPMYNEFAYGSWKHPTFGHDPQVSQKAHPFLYPALEAHSEEAIAAIAVALDEVVEACALDDTFSGGV